MLPMFVLIRHCSPSAEEKDKDTKEEGEDDRESGSQDREKTPETKEIRRRFLHKTSSIFLRNLAPSITKQEVEAVSGS